MKGLVFEEYPGPVHPNCKCEIRQEPVLKVDIHGTLQGDGDEIIKKFDGGQKIVVKVWNLGPFPGVGAWLNVDQAVWKNTGHIALGDYVETVFTKFGALPVPWEVRLIYYGIDNCLLRYAITD